MKKIVTLFAFVFFTVVSYPQEGTIKVKITGNGYSDETVVRFVQGATPGFDGSYDAWKMFSSNAQVPSLYTRLQQPGQEMAINAAGATVTDTSIALYALIPTSGTYTLDFIHLHQFPAGITCKLKELSGTAVYDVSTDTSYQMILNASSDSSALFALEFKQQGLVTGSGNDNKSLGYTEPVIKQSRGLVRFEALPFDNNYQVDVFGITGQLMASFDHSGESAEIDLNAFEKGVYIISMHNNSRRIVKKISHH